MNTLTTKQAIEEALKDIKALSREELRLELDRCSTGPLAIALKEAAEFIANHTSNERQS